MLNIWGNNLREEYHESSELNENDEFGKFLPKSNIWVYEFERRVPRNLKSVPSAQDKSS